MAPLLIGLTGSIGSGKSTVAAMLAEHGARIVSGDELGKRVLEDSPDVAGQLMVRLGADIRLPGGALDRKLIGERVFSSSELTHWLTELTFPGIYRLWRDEVRTCTAPLLVLDAALIFEWQIEHEFDLVILVATQPEIALTRARAEGRFTVSEIRDRLSSQMDVAEKTSRAHAVLDNNGSLGDLRRIVERLWIEQIEPLVNNRRAHD